MRSVEEGWRNGGELVGVKVSKSKVRRREAGWEGLGDEGGGAFLCQTAAPLCECVCLRKCTAALLLS